MTAVSGRALLLATGFVMASTVAPLYARTMGNPIVGGTESFRRVGVSYP